MATLCHRLLCFLLLLQLPLLISAQSNNNITLGSSLSTQDATPYWTSPSGDFAFGFHPHQDLFLLAIWFARIPVRTIVWTGNNGVPVGRGARVQLTSDGVLSLTSPNGTQIWRAEVIDNSQITHAALLNTGNFILSSTESNVAWESFQNPTDTILPTQILNQGSQLSSRFTEDNYTIGRFVLEVGGNLELHTVARPESNNNEAYWASNTSMNGSQLVFNQSGYIYLTLRSGGNYFLSLETPVSTTEYYQRATLDFDGVLRQYTYPRTIPSNVRWPSSWSTSWSLPADICSLARSFGDFGSGACGFNSYCRLNQEQRPECECPPGYVYINPNNSFGGCKQNFMQQSCQRNEMNIADGFEMRQLPSTDWPNADYEWFKSVTEEWCSETCLNNCFCAAAIIREGNCWLKKFPLSRGYLMPGSAGKALIKVGNSSIEHVPSTICVVKSGNEKRWIIPVSIILGISVFVNLLQILLRYKKETTSTQKDTGASGVNLQSFTYKELEEATDGFKEELGQGAFSTVYKGVLKSDGGLVAVKRLDRVVEGNDKKFKAEMMAIAKTNHKNLVQLLGFCDEEANRLLVYEFMRNGSLENFLFGDKRLDWNQRIQIAYGIARGLAYLHEDCSSKIIHCDVKPQNILLDDSYVARIADFGLAKLLKGEQTKTMTGIRGTRGYVAPEWFRNMAITAKVDVYSFGIMLLEIICCKKNAKPGFEDEDVELLSDWAYDCCVHKKLYLLVDNDEKAKHDSRTLERLVKVSLWCIQEEPSLRPSMKKVSQMLEGTIEVPMPPDPLSFVSSIS